jgi:hypothetical protein
MSQQEHAAPTSAPVSIDRFGKDHWSMLAYVETLCVDSSNAGIGQIDLRRVRANERTHPLLSVNGPMAAWKPNFGTRLKGFFDFAGRNDPAAAEAAGLQLTAHDDWDCLDDLEAAGLVETLSRANGAVRMTEPGLLMSARLRQHKAQGGMFANFDPDGLVSAQATTPAPVASAPRPR